MDIENNTANEESERMYINYGHGVFTVPESVLPKLKNAKKNDIIILLSFLSDPGASVAAIASACGVDEAAAFASLSYWRGAGILSFEEDMMASGPAPEKGTQIKKREKLLEETPHYTSEEVANIVSGNEAVSSMLDECQQILGKIFGQTETVRIVSVMEYYSLEPEYILLVATHCAASGRKNVAYLVSMTAELCSRGITDADTLNSYFMAIEKNASLETKIRALFGIGMARALSEREAGYIKEWSDKFGYGIDIITIAYNITVDSTDKPSMPYANAIMQKWFEAGLKTDEEIRNYLDKEKKQKTKQPGASKRDPLGGKSFDSAAFFNASLLRTYGSDSAVPRNALDTMPGSGKEKRNVGPLTPPKSKD